MTSLEGWVDGDVAYLEGGVPGGWGTWKGDVLRGVKYLEGWGTCKGNVPGGWCTWRGGIPRRSRYPEGYLKSGVPGGWGT